MKKGEILIYGLFAMGLIFKLFKLPMHTVFLLITLLALFLYYIVCLFRKNKEVYTTLTGLTTVLWLFSLLTILKHFTFQNSIFLLALLASLALVIPLHNNKKLTSANSVFCILIVGITLFFKFLPAHHTYFLTNIKFNYEIENDYSSWDKYSWFLYTAGKQTEALQANTHAQQAVHRCLANPHDAHGNEQEYVSILTENRLKIENRNWEKHH